MKSLLDQMSEQELLDYDSHKFIETTIQQKSGTGALRIYSFT